MKMKRIAIAVGAVAGLSVAAPAWVMAAGTQSGEGGYQSGMGQETADTAAMEQQAGGQDLMQMQVSELEGKTVKNQNGEDLGQVENIVKHKQDQNLHAVISTGGFLGVGAKRVSIPVDQLKLQDGDLVASISESPEEFEQQMAYNEADYDPVDSNQQLAEASGISPGQAEIASFEELDVDQSGSISRDEVEAYSDLLNQWNQYDTNADDQLDQAEFSAFEQSLGEDTGDQETGAQPAPMEDQSAMEPQGEVASFDSLDSDKDGYISEQEAQQHEALSRNWQDVDVNADNQVDQAEFSAFESGLTAPEQPGMEREPGAMESPQPAPGAMGTE